ncbi:hypothetical protein [Shouchella patagoniensis]|uniref:hypothetical protein n=1 Tax=Shouchella patagoniensis TaxID=228576 RepID=UPI000995D15D|nr:hypothetical protein [Shouchella patagoniensis]
MFGNFGWDETPLGSDGLLAFNRLGEKLWSASGYEVADCYALNVENAANVYFYYYDSFRFIHLSNYAEVASYNVKGKDTIDQFVLVGNTILAVVDTHSVMQYEVRNRTLKPKGSVDFINGKGKRIKGTIYMRGENVYLITKDMVYWKGVQGFL